MVDTILFNIKKYSEPDTAKHTPVNTKKCFSNFLKPLKPKYEIQDKKETANFTGKEYMMFVLIEISSIVINVETTDTKIVRKKLIFTAQIFVHINITR